MTTLKTEYAVVEAYLTKDGSIIRELMHPAVHGNEKQSLAEATIPVGMQTQLHRHGMTEELYYITAGEGVMTLGDEVFPVTVGDTIAIMPGMPHCVRNAGKVPLTLLCACAPAYSHEDTELLGDKV